MRGERRVCSAQCGRWADRKTDQQIADAVADLWSGKRWHDVMREHRVDRETIIDRARSLGLAVPIGRRRTIKPYRLTLPSDPAKLAYLAGIVDGEGSITVRLAATPRAYVFVAISNTSNELRHWLAPLGGTFVDKKRDGSLGHKPVFNWVVRSRLDCLGLLKAIEPYMVIKRTRAQEAIAILEEWDCLPTSQQIT